MTDYAETIQGPGDYHDLACECARHCRNCRAELVGRQRLYCSDHCGRQWRAELELDRIMRSAPTVPRGAVSP